jgi:hypothetical protein
MRLIDPRSVIQAISRIGSPGRAYRSGTTCILGAPKVPLPHLGRRFGPAGENRLYGILEGTMETSASYEGRSAPSSYSTLDHLRLQLWNRRAIVLSAARFTSAHSP